MQSTFFSTFALEEQERRLLEAKHFKTQLSNELIRTIFDVLTKLQDELSKRDGPNPATERLENAMFHSTIQRTKDMIEHFLNNSMIWDEDSSDLRSNLSLEKLAA